MSKEQRQTLHRSCQADPLEPSPVALLCFPHLTGDVGDEEEQQ